MVSLPILLYFLKKKPNSASLILCSFSSCFTNFCLIFITSLHFLIWICLFFSCFSKKLKFIIWIRLRYAWVFLNVGIDNCKIPFQNCLCWVTKVPVSFAFILFQEFLNFLPDFSDLWNTTKILFSINMFSSFFINADF